jgi:hypothetical protein
MDDASDAEWEAERRRQSAALLEPLAAHFQDERFLARWLEGRNVLQVCAPPGYPGIPSGKWWSLWDNGGEVGVELIHSDELPRFAPTVVGAAP